MTIHLNSLDLDAAVRQCRKYADGRPDEVIRAALERYIAAEAQAMLGDVTWHIQHGTGDWDAAVADADQHIGLPP